MSDLACWQHSEYEVVLRIRGNEYLMQEREAMELFNHVNHVIRCGAKESLGEEYAKLRQRATLNSVRQSPKVAIANLKAALGLKQETFRR